MEYKQITNMLKDLNKTTKLEKLSHKRFNKNIITNYDNFNNILNGMLQIFSLKDIYLVSETKNINLDKKKNIWNVNITENITSSLSHVECILDIIIKCNTPQFINSYIDKNNVMSNDTNVTTDYFNENITNISLIEDWCITDVKYNSLNDIYKKKQYIPMMDYEYKYTKLSFIDYGTGFEWDLCIVPNDISNSDLLQSFKLMIECDYKLSSKSNVIEKKITELISVLKKIDGVVFCL
jgi:hypothetical protein